MAINRALMNRQMYNMGGPSLQAGAPDITLTGDMRPTYSAMRKQRMAFGGIAGADGRKKYGIGSWFQENVMDPIKENPVTSAVIGGGLLNQFGVPDVLTKIPGVGQYIDPDFGQNFLGNLLGKVPGVPDDLNLVIGDDRDLLGRLITGAGGDPNQIMNETDATDYLSGGGGQSTVDQMLGTSDYFPPLGTTGNTVANTFTNALKESLGINTAGGGGGGTNLESPAARDEYRLQQLKQQQLNANLMKALAAGTAAGAYVDSQPKDTIPTDTTGINFQTAQQVLDDPNQRFKPPVEATQLAANGGRIGYDIGGDVDPMTPDELPYARDVMPMKNRMPLEKIIEAYMKSQEGMYFLRKQIDQGKSMQQIINDLRKEMENMDLGMMVPKADQSPDATPIPEGMMINPRKTMEFRDVNQNGIPDRDEGIYSKDRDFVPKKDFPNMDPVFTIPRVTRAEGGLMDLGGMEKDYREEGGFVPIGGKEKADDVPARLSKNEFVFTADAVRNAGGGDIDQGAQVMERLMKSLESGGQVSEESQGLDGAREMFETSQRLEKRII